MDDQNTRMNERERWTRPRDADVRDYATDPGFASTGSPSDAAPGSAVDRRFDESPTAGAGRGEDDPDRRIAAIRSDIEQTRADMSETVDAIQDRLNPRNVVSRAADSVREATVGRVRDMAHAAQERFGGTSRERAWVDDDDDTVYAGEFSVMDRIRENPVPAVMAAASLGWLFLGGRRRERHDAGGVYYGSSSSPRLMDERTREPMLRETRERASALAHRASDETSRTVRRTAQRARRVSRDNPLAAAGVAAIVGLAIGLMLPATERENELMGETRDELAERARQAAREAADRVQDVARDVQRVVTGEGGQGGQPGQAGS